MALFQNVTVFKLHENGETRRHFLETVTLRTEYDPQGISLSFLPKGDNSGNEVLLETLLERGNPLMRLGRCGFIISIETVCILFRFSNEQDASTFQILSSKALKGNDTSVFAERTEDSSALQYFQFYGYLSQQQNMMQDYIRTATYQKAIHANLFDFSDKVILDVGAGSGILSFFAIQAGAKKIYAVEASSMAQHAEALASHNGLKGKLIVLAGKIEEVELPEKVDAIVSEPMGYMLYNERMLETYLHAKKWLKPDGKMFPTTGDLHVAPFTDEALFLEQCNKANFWQQTSFHGVDLSCLRNAAMKEYFRQPIVDTFDVRICLAKSTKHTVNFLEASEYDLHEINIPFEFEMLETGTVHGLAFWFDVAFEGTQSTVWLSTAPTEALTHWYQVRCLVETPRVMLRGQTLKGKTILSANKRQSYDVYIELEFDGVVVSNTLDLKNPYFRYTGQAPQPPPGHQTTAPSDAIWTTTAGTPAMENGGGHLVKGLTTTVVDSMGNIVEVPTAAHPVMSVLPSGVGNMATHQFQQAASLAHYTTVPILGDYTAAAGGQHQGLLLNNTNVSVLPTSHGVHWSH